MLPSDQVVERYEYNPNLFVGTLEEIAKLPLYNVGDGSVFSYRYFINQTENLESYWFFMFYNDTTFIIVRTIPTSKNIDSS